MKRGRNHYAFPSDCSWSRDIRRMDRQLVHRTVEASKFLHMCPRLRPILARAMGPPCLDHSRRQSWGDGLRRTRRQSRSACPAAQGAIKVPSTVSDAPVALHASYSVPGSCSLSIEGHLTGKGLAWTSQTVLRRSSQHTFQVPTSRCRRHRQPSLHAGHQRVRGARCGSQCRRRLDPRVQAAPAAGTRWAARRAWV